MRNKAKMESERKKNEIMKQLETLKKRGKISQDDLFRLGLANPILVQPSGDLQ